MKKNRAVLLILSLIVASSIVATTPIRVKAQIVASSSSSGPSQTPAMAWSNVYGTGNCDLAPSAIQTSDSGYALVGNVRNDQKNAFLIKTDALGNMLWNRTYSSPESFRAVLQASDGGYILLGNTNGGGFTLMKTDPEGDIEWNQTYTGIMIASNALGGIEATSMVHTSDGGYAIAGRVGVELSGSYSSTYAFLIKTDALGNIQWSRLYLQYGSNTFWSIVQTSGGEYAMAGSSEPYDSINTSFWLVKTDWNGNTLWNKTYETRSGNDSEAFSMVETDDGGYALIGNSISFVGSTCIVLLVKTDPSGNMVWYQTYDRPSVKSLIQTSDGGFAFSGTMTVQLRNGPDTGYLGAACLVKLSPAGRIEWNETFYSPEVNFNPYFPIQDMYMATSAIEANDGSIVLAGTWYRNSTSSYYFLVKTEPSLPLPTPFATPRQTPQPTSTLTPAPSAPTPSPLTSDQPNPTQLVLDRMQPVLWIWVILVAVVGGVIALGMWLSKKALRKKPST